MRTKIAEESGAEAVSHFLAPKMTEYLIPTSKSVNSAYINMTVTGNRDIYRVRTIISSEARLKESL